MTPESINEIRDLQPVVSLYAIRCATVFASLLCMGSFVALVSSIRALASQEQVYAVTSSGHTFRIKPIGDDAAEKILALPGAAQAVVEASK